MRGLALAFKRLIKVGVPSDDALAWLDAWDVTTAGLVDFRRAPDFWELGYEYALEEYRLGFNPPVVSVSGQVTAELAVTDDSMGRRWPAAPAARETAATATSRAS